MQDDKKDKKLTGPYNEQEINKKIEGLLVETNDVITNLRNSRARSKRKIDASEQKINDTTTDVQKLFNELDQIEDAANTELDKLILGQVQYISED